MPSGAAQRLLVLLDSGPLGLVSHPRATSDAGACKAWLSQLLAQNHTVLLPEIVYYETRRELRRLELRSGVPSPGLANMEAFAAGAGIVPLTSAALHLASEFWAIARNSGSAGAPDLALDADVILCAQAKTLKPESWGAKGARVVIATTNVKHLVSFADASHWQNIWP